MIKYSLTAFIHISRCPLPFPWTQPPPCNNNAIPGHVVEGSAVRVLAADIGQTADIDTLVADAGPLPGAVSVGHTLELDTPDQGVTIGPRGAGAHRLVIGWSADGISSA